jgi:hypothetical protein
MKQQVIVSTCDQCGTEDVRSMPRAFRGVEDRVVLPPKWLHVSGQTGSAVVFSLDLCPQCVGPVLKVAGAYKRSRDAA